MKVDYYAITLRVKSFGDGEFATVAQIPNCFFEIAEKLSTSERKICLLHVYNKESLEIVVDRCKGVILTGSREDVNPLYYTGDKNYSGEDGYSFTRDVIKAFNEQNKSIFGICFGIQCLNVYYGGTLCNVSNHRGISHPVLFTDDFKYNNSDTVMSFHNQAVKDIAPNAKLLATSEEWVVEMVQYDEKVFGVQYHPEIDFDKSQLSQYLFKQFLIVRGENIMGVCLKRITCLSLDAENEKYYDKKCFVGDTVTLFLTNGSNIQGSIKKLGNQEIEIVARDNKCYLFSYSNIRSFNLDFRCQDSRYKFGS